MGMITEEQLRQTLQDKINASINDEELHQQLVSFKNALLGGVNSNYDTLASIVNLVMDGKILNSDYFNLAVIDADRDNVKGTELWLLINARYNEQTKRFERIDVNNFSFGWQMQAGGTYPGEAAIGDTKNQGMNLWKANGKGAYAEGSDAYNQTGTDIGVMENGVWREFGVMLGWNNVFMNDSYGGMTIGGAGFEIDGNGLSPFKRVSLGKFSGGSNVADKPIQDYVFAYNGTLWNIQHGLYNMDVNSIDSFWYGLKCPINWYDSGNGKFDPYSCRADMNNCDFVIQKLPANKPAHAENWVDVLNIDCNTYDAKIGGKPVTTTLVVPVAIVNKTDFNMNYPDSTWNENNTLILGVKGVVQNGENKQIKQLGSLNATFTQYGVYGYLGQGFISAELIITKY